jgi:hypothetical protein
MDIKIMNPDICRRLQYFGYLKLKIILPENNFVAIAQALDIGPFALSLMNDY